MNRYSVYLIACFIVPVFFYSELERWQQYGCVFAAVLWLINIAFVGSPILEILAYVILFISCLQLLVEFFPLR